MTPADRPDDDRTVIRPTGGAPAGHTTGPGPTVPPTRPVPDRTVAAGPAPAFEARDNNGLPVGTYLGEFELTAMVGEGGFGIVYEAYDHSLQRRVALKEYMPSSLAARASSNQVTVKSERHRDTFEAGLKSFINEARLLASFDHPSLVKVYRFWEANGTAYMVMPFLEGVTLKDCLRDMHEPPDEAWLLSVLGPVTEALAVIHAEQCYHRDIAPDNIMRMASNNRWLVLDFGAARRVIGDMTQALTVILKPGYAPVEQYAEIPGMKQGAWTDVYALAAVVHFAITGKTPPPSVGRLLNDTYVPLAQCAAGRYSPGFLAAIDRALAVRPEERTQTIAQLRAEIGLGAAPPADAYTTKPFAPGDVPPRPAPVPPPTSRPAAAPPPATVAAPAAPAKAGTPVAGIAAGAVALVALAVGAYFWLAPAPRPAPAAVTAAAPAPSPLPAEAPPPPAPAAAVVPATPSPEAPPATAGLEPRIEFERAVQAQSAGYDVQAQAAKTTLRIDRDELQFTVTAQREGFLYVFVHDSSGALAQVVPNSRSGTVRLKKGQTFRFPTGDGFYLATTDPAGPGGVLVLVSALQRDFRDLSPRTEGLIKIFPTGADAVGTVQRHKGPQPLLAGNAICPSSGACDDSYGAALIKTEAVR